MKLTLGFSPCPNDTFIFDALVHGKIDTDGLEFDVALADVEALNNNARKAALDITKVSYAAYPGIATSYILSNAGSALGRGVGPLLISKKTIPASAVDETLSIAIPGHFTTANFLMSLAFPKASNKKEMVFSDIERAVLDGEYDAGLIIHENRFTYAESGLEKIMDLGDYWEKLSNAPIPLGGIAIKRSLPLDIQLKVNRLIRSSVQYAFANPASSKEYIRKHAQEMSDEVQQKHIELYVNNYSVDLGAEGREAIQLLFSLAIQKGAITSVLEPIFLKK